MKAELIAASARADHLGPLCDALAVGVKALSFGDEAASSATISRYGTSSIFAPATRNKHGPSSVASVIQ